MRRRGRRSEPWSRRKGKKTREEGRAQEVAARSLSNFPVGLPRLQITKKGGRDIFQPSASKWRERPIDDY